MAQTEAAAPGALTIHSNLWVEASEQVVLSQWRVRLLEAIEATGSIRAAAAELKITYDLAWHRIDEMETALGAGLVSRQRGGVKGGCAYLTPLGCKLVARFNHFRSQADGVIRELFQETFGGGDLGNLPDLRAPE